MEESQEQDSTEVDLKEAILIIIRLQWTKLDKLSQKIICCGTFTTKESLNVSISLIAGKAQLEPRFQVHDHKHVKH